MKKRFFVILPILLICVSFLFAGCGLSNGQFYFTNLGNGMAPSGIESGDKIIIEEVMISEIQVGDIILFYQNTLVPNFQEGTKEDAEDFKTGKRNINSPLILHKVYNIKYDRYGQTWFYTYGTNNRHGEDTDDSSVESVERNYVVDVAPVVGSYVVGKYVGKAQ